MEFLINTADNPLAYHGDKLPIFSFSVDKNHADIMYPAWAFWSGGPAISLYPRGLGRFDKKSAQSIRAIYFTTIRRLIAPSVTVHLPSVVIDQDRSIVDRLLVILRSVSIISAGEAKPWADRKDLAFFRGARTTPQRDAIVFFRSVFAAFPRVFSLVSAQPSPTVFSGQQ